MITLSNLYRCHARVAYKPYEADYAIVFEERQIAQLELNLNVNLADMIKQQIVVDNIFNTDNNTCRITLTDPYLDSVAWTTLDEVNSLTGIANLEGNSGGLLRKCKPGEDPSTTRCFPYARIDNCDVVNRSFPVVIITLWYEIGSQIVEQNFYYEVLSTSIKHGSGGMPTVTIGGRHAFEVIFQQNIQPTFFEKNKNVVDEFNEKIFKREGYTIEDVCADPANEPKTDRTYRVNNLTPLQILNKYVNTKEGSQVLSLPVKEFANKIQMCTKSNSFCYSSRVFYLGKGLYEEFSIESKFPKSDVPRNTRQNSNKIPPAPASSEEVTTYTVSVPDPLATRAALSKVNAEAFGGFTHQFSDVEDYFTGDSSDVYKGIGSGEELTVEKNAKVSKLGDAISPSAYLGGRVTKANKEDKSVEIKSNFYIQYCREDYCSRAVVYQEYRNLKNVSVDYQEVLTPGQSIGELEEDPQKKSKTRFYAKLRTGELITLEPPAIPSLVSTTGSEICDETVKNSAPSSAPTALTQTNSGSGTLAGYIGKTGTGTGPHLHAEIRTPGGGVGSATEITMADLDKYITIGGKKPSEWSKTGEYNESRPGGRIHQGIDIGGENINEQPIRAINGATLGQRSNANGYGNFQALNLPDGRELFMGHLSNKVDNAPTTPGESALSTTGQSQASPFGGAAATQDGIKIKTKFKGVPKALLILPGRTMLSFVTNYDQWIQSSKSPGINPGVWIPDRYRNWYITKTEFTWNKGDLRMQIEAVIPWLYNGSKDQAIGNVPTWEEHRQSKQYIDYYDYMRSAGDLCFKASTGEDSCAALCTKPAQQAGSASNSVNVSASSVYAQGKFTYAGSNQSAVQSLLNAAEAAGVKSNIGQAAIVGNAQKESFLRLDPTAVGDTGTALGVFQWRADRQDNLRALGNSPESREQQMRWFVKELQDYPGLINYLNRDDITLDQAVREFGRVYLRPGTPDYPTRTQYAQDILNNMR